MATKTQYGHRKELKFGYDPKLTKLCPEVDI